MSALSGATLSDAGIDAVALKPAEMDLRRATGLSVDTLTVDYEGRDHVPAPETLVDLASEHAVRVTVPVRADGYDPRGEDDLFRAIPTGVGLVVVAGHPTYLGERERQRAVAPRLREAADRGDDPWIGTEGIERIALAVGGTQYDLLSGSTVSDVRALRAAGFDGGIAVYAPTVLTDDANAVLDAVGAYAARRPSMLRALPDDSPVDSAATGEARETLLAACREYALVGSADGVSDRVADLREAGVDQVVGYPARGLDPFLE